jgi:hypothetical protein
MVLKQKNISETQKTVHPKEVFRKKAEIEDNSTKRLCCMCA